MKRLLLITVFALATLGSIAAVRGTWRLYNTFNSEVKSVVDTPDKVYFLSNAQEVSSTVAQNAVAYPMLHVYDKQADEMRALTRADGLHSSIVESIAYNSRKGYLMMVYSDADIDLLYDDGKVVNIPFLRLASIGTSKKVNGIVFDTELDRVYLATDFGYAVIDDSKMQIAESRVFKEAVNSAARVGDHFIVMTPTKSYWTTDPSRALTLADYQEMNLTAGSMITPCSTGFFYVTPDTWMYQIIVDGDTFRSKRITSDIMSVSENKLGHWLSGGRQGIQLMRDGTYEFHKSLPGIYGDKHGSWDNKEAWWCQAAKGMGSFTIGENDQYTITRDLALPNSPNPFLCRFIRYNPGYGMMFVNHGHDRIFNDHTIQAPIRLSGLSQGDWTSYGPAYTGSPWTKGFYNPNGLAIDPNDRKMVYFGSFREGLMRINLDNPQDNLNLSRASSDGAALKGYNKFFPTDPQWSSYCNVVGVDFDTDGNLWFLYHKRPSSSSESGWANFFLWEPTARKGGSISTIKSLEYKNLLIAAYSDMMIPKATSNKGLILVQSTIDDYTIYVLDTNNTPTDTSDDRIAKIEKPYDQDGNTMPVAKLYDWYEDPETGNIWMAHGRGVFYFNPVSAFSNPDRITRIKVARNDGTNLADYLLDNVQVHAIAADDQGRKWFGTNAGGIVVTSSDGREILDEFTSENSLLPGNTIYEIEYNPENRSMAISTSGGLCEFYLTGTSSSGVTGDAEQLHIYPNPVRPDYLGWINIENLPDDCVVKIVDSGGHVVRELGRVQNGKTQWDGCNSEFKRVASGVYFILASSGPNTEDVAAKGKVLVIN